MNYNIIEYDSSNIKILNNIEIISGNLIKNGIDIIQSTCNYTTSTSNTLISKLNELNATVNSDLTNKIDNLNLDDIANGSINKYIINNTYANALILNDDLTVTGNTYLNGNEAKINSELYTSNIIDIVNNTANTCIKVTQYDSTNDVLNINNSTKLLLNIKNNGNIGIGTIPTNTLDVNGNLGVSGNATITSDLSVSGNLTVSGTTTQLNTDVYATEKLEIEYYGVDTALLVSQSNSAGDIITASNIDSKVFSITSDGKISVGNIIPAVSLDLSYNTDALKLPKGNNSAKNAINATSENDQGLIRYNTESKQFEGFGAGNAWGSLGGVIDVDQDTKILAETSANADNDELQFITAGFQHMIIKQDGKIGINTSLPAFSFDLNTVDGIKIPAGTEGEKPTNLVTSNYGLIRFNTTSGQFEGFGAGNAWGSLGGVIDVDQDTKILAETSANADNDELQFITAGFQHMIIKQDGKIGINTSLPAFSFDLNTVDGIKIPAGTEGEKPTNLVTSNYGLIRFNTTSGQFEGFGAGNAWGSLGGVIDVDQDTKILAETSANADNDELQFITAGNINMVITSNGFVGIGTESPTDKLHIKDGNLRIENSGSDSLDSKIIFEETGYNDRFFISTDLQDSLAGNQHLRFGYTSSGDNGITNANVLFNISGNGNVGIGNTSPSHKLYVSGNIYSSGNINSSGNIYSSGNINSSGNIYANNNIGVKTTSPAKSLHVVGEIVATNKITSYYSDERLKTNIKNIEQPLELIKNLNGFYYTPNELAESFGIKSNNREIGLSAQEVNEILPELTYLAPFDMCLDNEGNIKSKSGNNYLTISYERMIPVIIESLKELTREVEALKIENKMLKEKLM